MTTREKLDLIMAELPESRQSEVLDFARFLRWVEKLGDDEFRAWTSFGPGIPELYGPDEPEYTEADIKERVNP